MAKWRSVLLVPAQTWKEEVKEEEEEGFSSRRATSVGGRREARRGGASQMLGPGVRWQRKASNADTTGVWSRAGRQGALWSKIAK